MDIIISALDLSNPRFLENIIGAHLGHARMAAGNIPTQRVSHPHDLSGSARKIALNIHTSGHRVAQDVIIFAGCFVDAGDVALARRAMEVYRLEVNPAALAIYVERA